MTKVDGVHCNHQDWPMMFPVSPLSWLHCGLLVDFIQDLQYLGQVVLVPLEFWLWLRWSLVTEPPANVDIVSGVLQDTLWASCDLQGVDVNLVTIINFTQIMWKWHCLVVFLVYNGWT